MARTYTQEQLQEWKNQYGHVYKSQISGEVFVWRRLKRAEYTDIMAETLADDTVGINEDTQTRRLYKRQELVAKKVVIFPENFEELLENIAGAATVIAEEVMDHSGFMVEVRSEEL